MSKRGSASLIVAMLLLAPISNANAATAKAGAPCTKLKATAIVNGKKFTCIKSGKKLIWDKGVNVKATSPKPTPKPSLSAAAVSCSTIDAADQQGISQIRADSLIGMSESQASLCADSLNWGFRIGQRDNEMFALTMDYRSDRVTVLVKLGVVTRVDVG